MKILDKLMFWKKDNEQSKTEIKEKRIERKKEQKEKKLSNDAKDKIKYEKKEVELRENKKEDFENTKVADKQVTNTVIHDDNDEQYNKVKTLKPKKEVKKEIKKEKFDLFGLEIEDIIVGNKYRGEVVSKTNSEYIVFVQGSYNDVILPVSKTIQDINVGDEIDLIVSHRKDGNFIASQKDLEKYEKKAKVAEYIAENNKTTGTVTGFKNNVFTVTLENGLPAYCYIKNMEYSFIEEPELYVGKTLDFEIDQENLTRIDLNRRELSKQELYDKVNNLQVGDIIEFDEYEFENTGLVVKKDGLRFFIPLREISHAFVTPNDDIESIIEGNKFELIDIKERKNKDFSLVGSIKNVLPDPMEVLKEHYPVDSEIDVEVRFLKDYGVIFNVKDSTSGLLHQNDMSNEDATNAENWKKGDIITLKVLEYNEDNTLKLKSL